MKQKVNQKKKIEKLYRVRFFFIKYQINYLNLSANSDERKIRRKNIKDVNSLKALVVDLNAKIYLTSFFCGKISIYKFSFVVVVVVVFMLLIPEREWKGKRS